MLMSFRRFGARRRVVAEDCCDRRARLLIRTRPLQYPQHLLCLGRQGIDVQNLAVARLGQLNVTFPLMLQSLLEKFLQTLLRRNCGGPCAPWIAPLPGARLAKIFASNSRSITTDDTLILPVTVPHHPAFR